MPPRTAGSAKWTAADAVLLDEVRDQLQRTPSRAHVVLDEAQDLSAMQLRAVGRRCSTGAATVLGDIAQGTTPWAARSWDDVLVHLGKPDGELEVLDRGFRVPAAVIDYAARLLPRIAPDLTVPRSVRTDPGLLEVLRVEDPVAQAARTVRELADLEGSVGVVVASAVVEDVARELTAQAWSSPGSTTPTPTSSGSPSSPRRWSRAWSSTASSSWNPRPWWPGNPTSAPVCGAST